ncbi:MAG: hypothetical protein SVY41_02170 [Candidatus Nanohaloarchaea archaeon]|nr:hypothetical protein [Candidatus Nanohaloarchaea archaeon]
MGESWTDKTVSMENLDKDVFDTALAHVTVSENGISVEFKQVEDWKRIQREVGDDTILRQVRWDDVETVETETEHLYYPHIDVESGEGEQRIYFLEDETDVLEECVNAINRFWNAYRGSGSGSRTTYDYDDGDRDESETGGEAAEEVELSDEEDSQDADSGDDEGEDETGGSVEDVVEEFIDS